MSMPSMAEVEHADWPALKAICEALRLNPKGRSAVVRMRVFDHVRRRVRAEPWRPGSDHQAAFLTRLGFPDLAERLWESTIRLDAPTPWVGLGHAQLAGGLLTEATRSFDRAAKMGDAAAHLHRAEALAAGGDFDGAARACDAYLAAHPGDLRAQAMKAGFLARAGFAEEAANVLRAAGESHPDVHGLGRSVGTALLKAGRHEAAAEAFRDALQLDPKDVDAWINRGTALLLAGRAREAIGVLREALELDPRRAEALSNLGAAYLQIGQAKSAAVNLERAAKHLESPRILLNLAKVREAAQERDDALRAYNQVLRMAPKDAEARAARKRLASPSRARRPVSRRSKKSREPARHRTPKRSGAERGKSEQAEPSRPSKRRKSRKR